MCAVHVRLNITILTLFTIYYLKCNNNTNACNNNTITCNNNTTTCNNNTITCNNKQYNFM